MFTLDGLLIGMQVISDFLWLLRSGFIGKTINVRLTTGEMTVFTVPDNIDVLFLHSGDLAKGNPDSLMAKVPPEDSENGPRNAKSLKILRLDAGAQGHGWQSSRR